jgi:flagellar protein FliO/FliZ
MPELPTNTVNIVIAAGAVLALLIVVLLVWRALSPRMSGRRGQRLGISEYHELDKTRRLVLVRRDNVEHLIMIGGPQDVVIEQAIQIPGAAAAYVPQAQAEAPTPRPAPRPAVFGDRRPAPLRPADAQDPPLTS